LGRTIVQNIVMVGFFAGVTDLVPENAVRDAVKGSVPAGTEDLNLEAFEKGLEYARKSVDQPSVNVTRPSLEEVSQ